MIRKLSKSTLERVQSQNIMRSHLGLESLEIKIRKCLRCSRKFESAGNRLCGCQKRLFDLRK